MKIDPDLKRDENFAEKTTFYSNYLAKDIKMSNFLGGNPNNFLIFIANFNLLILVCLKFSFNFV